MSSGRHTRGLVAAGRRSGGLPLFALLMLLVPPLLAGDYAHRYTQWAFFTSDLRWNVDLDRSFIEFAGYGQLLAAAVLLFVLARRRRPAPVFLAWAVALIVVVADDALEWHEGVGGWLERRFELPAVLGLRPIDLGELMFWAGMGIVVAPGLYLAHRLSPARPRHDSLQLLKLIAVLVIFGVVVDMLHSGFYAVLPTGVDTALIWLEAAGELVAMSALFAYVVHLVRTPLSPPQGRLPREADRFHIRDCPPERPNESPSVSLGSHPFLLSA